MGDWGNEQIANYQLPITSVKRLISMSQFKVDVWGIVFASLIGVNPTLTDQALLVPVLAQDIPINSSEVQTVPQFLVDAVRWDLSIELGIHPDRLSLVQGSRQQWPDTCLGLALPGEFCAQQIIPGWRIVLSDGSRSWGYRSDVQGQIRRLETTPQEIAFPLFLQDMVLKTVAEESQQPIDSLAFQQAIPQTWPDTCLGLGGNNCTAIAIPGWQITVISDTLNQTWDYRTNRDGSIIRQAIDQSSAGTPELERLPESVRQAVLKDLARRRRLPLRTIEIVNATPEIWSDNCLGLPFWNSECEEGELDGWRVVVKNSRRSWVYRTDSQGEIVYPENN